MKSLLALLPLATACGLDNQTINEQEVITSVVLDFDGTRFEFNDPDGDGGEDPTIDPVVLAPGNYTLTVRFENRLEDPPEDITEEVNDESDQHLVLFTGSAVVGPATDNATGPFAHTYADEDVNGLPIGLTNTIVATPGTGMMTVTLRHMPPEEPPEKAEDTLDIVRIDGFDSIGGSTDARVIFDVTVQ